MSFYFFNLTFKMILFRANPMLKDIRVKLYRDLTQDRARQNIDYLECSQQLDITNLSLMNSSSSINGFNHSYYKILYAQFHIIPHSFI